MEKTVKQSNTNRGDHLVAVFELGKPPFRSFFACEPTSGSMRFAGTVVSSRLLRMASKWIEGVTSSTWGETCSGG